MLRMIRFVVFGSRKKHLKKLAARKRMQRVQKIMAHHRLHEAERKRPSSAGGQTKDFNGKDRGQPKRGGTKRKTKKKQWGEKVGKVGKEKQKMQEQKKRKQDDALKRAKTLRERVKQSKERGRDLWAGL